MSLSAADAFSYPPSTVKPRSRKSKRLPVMALSGDSTLDERGEVRELSHMIATLRERESTLFVKRAAADFIGQLDRYFRECDPEHWQWRISTSERDIIRPADNLRVATRVSTVIHYFGFKGGNYHKIIDPITMYGHSLDKIWPGDESQMYRLLQWGIALRNFCSENDMTVKPTIGSMATQLLTDKRFYPKARRKVPAVINERARDNLPGNHYVLAVAATPYREYTALYIDQRRAHHYHASITSFPASDSLYAYGRFSDLSEVAFEKPIPQFYGLYCLDLIAPPVAKPSHWLHKLDKVFVFSNELAHLVDMGYKVTGVYAAWGSHTLDRGLNRYATWANLQLDRYQDAPWIKPLLLAVYGTLATKPTYGETIFRLAKKGEPATVLTGHNSLTGKMIQRSKKLEPGIANVIHRGMIEAATRSESVGLAQWLAYRGHRVLSIYADAVIVRDDEDKQLPPLPEPWRIKTTLNHLQFVNQQAFISGELTKLPGVGQELRQYRQSTIPGYAPRKEQYVVGSNQTILSDRRI